MRIALFTETFLPKIDGIVNTLCHLLDHLAVRGHESILFTPHSDRERYAHTRLIPYRGIPFPLYPELKVVPPFVPIGEELRTFRPDVVHVLNPISLGVAGMVQARLLNVPVVASYHTDIAGFAAHWGLAALRRPIWDVLRLLHNYADLTLCPSAHTKRQVDAHGFVRTRVWTRGVDTTQFHPRRRSDAWRERLTGGAPERPLLLFVSRLSAEKRVDWLLPVIEALPEARLAIVGDGPAREKLTAQFAGTPTLFTGFLRGADLAAAYAAADLFVFPAPNETLGNVVLEAMASGLPVIVPNSGGPRELVDDGHTGLLVPPHDPDAFSGAARRLLATPQRMRHMGGAARAFAESRSWATVMDGLLADYRAAIVGAPGAQRPARRRGDWRALLSPTTTRRSDQDAQQRKQMH